MMHGSLGHDHLVLKGIDLVVNQVPLWVSHVGLSQPHILLPGFFDRLIPRIISGTVIELLSAISRGNQVKNCVIPLIPKLDRCDSELVKETLPLRLIDIGRPIHEASIDKND